MSKDAKSTLDELDAHVREKVAKKITTWLVDQRRLGNAIPKVTTTIIEDAMAARDLTADERAERLLGFLAQQTPNLGMAVEVAQLEFLDQLFDSKTSFDFALQAKAISESVGIDELIYLLKYLESVGWMKLAVAIVQSFFVPSQWRATDGLRNKRSTQVRTKCLWRCGLILA